MLRKAAPSGTMYFGLLKLRSLPGRNEEYELTFATARNQTNELQGHFRGTRTKTASVLAELGIEDSKATVFEAANLGFTSRHVSLGRNDIDYLQKLLKREN